MATKRHRYTAPSLLAYTAMTLAGGLSSGVTSAQTIYNTHTNLADQSICLQKSFGPSPLTCTANDIKIAKAVDALEKSCVKGESIDIHAVVEIEVNASSRYDTAYFFRTDGGSARGDGASGEGNCSVLSFAAEPNNPPSVDLDRDPVGDIQAGRYTVYMTIPGVTCDDTDGDRQLNIPNCTSWHSKANVIADPSNAYSLKPDTKSKCNCDDSFNVPVDVELTELLVTKSAIDTLAEPGGAVTFTISLENLKSESIDILSILDDRLGDLGSASNTGVYENDCPSLIQTTLNGAGSPSSTASCSFKADLWGNYRDEHTNVVTVTAYQPSKGQNVQGSDAHTVTFTDEYDAPTLTKAPTDIANCFMDVTYAVEVRNNSEVDTLTVDRLSDDKFGDLDWVHDDVVATTCATGGTIATNSVYSCAFTGRVASPGCDVMHTNEVTAGVTDDDGTSSFPSGSATVTLSTSGVPTPTP